MTLCCKRRGNSDPCFETFVRTTKIPTQQSSPLINHYIYMVPCHHRKASRVFGCFFMVVCQPLPASGTWPACRKAWQTWTLSTTSATRSTLLARAASGRMGYLSITHHCTYIIGFSSYIPQVTLSSSFGCQVSDGPRFVEKATNAMKAATLVLGPYL